MPEPLTAEDVVELHRSLDTLTETIERIEKMLADYEREQEAAK